jgi:tRNA threonylcarbamoyladenosine biosynthesis protein TsaB
VKAAQDEKIHEMRFAALETSTEWCSVALSLDGEIHAVERRAGNRASELVLPMLDQLLSRAGLEPRE